MFYRPTLNINFLVEKNNIFLRFCLCIFESDTVKSDCPVQIFRKMMKYLKITLLVFLEILKKKKEKKKLWKKKSEKKKLWKWPVNWSFSELFFLFFFVPPTLGLKKNSRKSTNKTNLALVLNPCKVSPIICSRQRFQIVLLFSKIQPRN